MNKRVIILCSALLVTLTVNAQGGQRSGVFGWLNDDMRKYHIGVGLSNDVYLTGDLNTFSDNMSMFSSTDNLLTYGGEKTWSIFAECQYDILARWTVALRVALSKKNIYYHFSSPQNSIKPIDVDFSNLQIPLTFKYHIINKETAKLSGNVGIGADICLNRSKGMIKLSDTYTDYLGTKDGYYGLSMDKTMTLFLNIGASVTTLFNGKHGVEVGINYHLYLDNSTYQYKYDNLVDLQKSYTSGTFGINSLSIYFAYVL